MVTTTLTDKIDGNKPSIIQVLTNKPFILLFIAQLAQNIGAAVSWLALQLYLFLITGSPAIMGALSIIFWLPYVIVTPLAGVFVDRYDKRKLMLLSVSISFLASLGYILVYIFKDNLIIDKIVTIHYENFIAEIHTFNYALIICFLFVLTFINSTAASIFLPARSAYTRFIIERKNLLIANSIIQTVLQIATIVGYVLAGFLAKASYLGSFIFNASTFAISISMIIFVLFIGNKAPTMNHMEKMNSWNQIKSVMKDIMIGYKTIQDHPKISYMLPIFASATFSFSAFSVLFIVILQREMKLDETWYGIMNAIMGISGIITALILMRIGKIKKKVLLLNITLMGLTIVLSLFAFIRNIWAMGAILFLLGIGIVCINIPAATLIQEQIPFDKQGRVFGAQQLIQGIARIAGLGIVSLIAEVTKPIYILLASSGLLALVMIFGFIYSTKKGLIGSDYPDTDNNKIKEGS